MRSLLAAEALRLRCRFSILAVSSASLGRLMSAEAIKAFSRLVLGIQKVLAHIRNDWILYFQSEGPEFIVWVYPDKIVITPEFEKNVRNLLQAR
ncbi:MAG: hypothetical protein Q8M07_28705 [Prosthecobacter sp.]|nr:hypothetical protein [Prosthecobacter sp.]